MVEDYNHFMSGVDIFDQRKASLAFNHRNKKWYMPVYHNLKDIALNNSRVIYETSQGKKIASTTYRKKLVEQMLGRCEVEPTAKPGR